MLRRLCLGLPLSLLCTSIAATELEAVTVTATRGNSEVGQTPQKITVIDRQQIEQQLQFSSDQAQILGNLIPTYTPSRQKMTNAGETFRGRNPLFLIDGVPQSNPLRDGSRDGYTIDFSLVERIEIIHGASAEHGLGATGGIINFVTRRPEGDRLSQHVGVRASMPTDSDSDGLGYKGTYRVEGLQDNWDFLVGGSYESRGMGYDAKGRPIGVDNAQGDTMDSQAHDVFAKLGYWFDDNQNLELSVNRFYLEGDYRYQLVTGDRDAGVPATSTRGHPEGDAPRNEVLTSSLTYRNRDLAGNDFKAQLYNQRFRARYGGSEAATFQDPAIAPVGTLFDQSQNESDKTGGKLTVTRDNLLDNRLKLTGGMDMLRDETTQVLSQTGREWVPETRFENIAPFLQAELRPLERLTLQAGVRHEYAKLEVDDFTTLASYNGGQAVEGGDPDFEDTLFNAGLVFQATDWAQLFANYSEGFGMADVGRVLRAIDQPNQRVDDFLALEPIVTDNREIGVRLADGPVDLELSYFESDSDLGARLENVNGFFEVRREKTEIHGVEADLNYQVDDNHRLGASYGHVSGRSDTDGDGSVDTRLDGRNISPDRVTLRWQAQWNDKLSSQLQGSHFFSRSFGDPDTNFEGYNLVDLALSYQLPKGTLSAGVENLFNEDYFTYYSQTVTTLDTQYLKGRGRVVSLGYDLSF